MREDVRAALSGKRALVSGGTGLIGRQVVDLLLACGAQVRSVSLDQLELDTRAEYVVGDLSDFALCRELVRGMDFVCHVAGVKGSIEVTRTKPASFMVPLLMMNTNLLEACRLEQVGRVVYTSSIGAYPSAEVFREQDDRYEQPPMDQFPGWAKRAAELQIQAYRIEYGLDSFAVVRPCNVYGPGDNFDPENAMVIPSLMARIHAGEDSLVVWGDGSALRDFAYSRDVAEGVILALHCGTAGGFMNLGSGEGISIRKLVETLREVVPFNYRFDSERSGGFPRRIMDITLAREKLGWEPRTSLVEGLRETWEWYRAHADEFRRRKNYFAGETK